MGIFDEEWCIECVNTITKEVVPVPFYSKMPSWDSVHASYRKQVSTQDPIAMESTSATRVATAILEGIQQYFGSTIVDKPKFLVNESFANVKELKEWLSEKDVWGTATVDGKIFKCEDGDKEIMEQICGRNGVIIIERKNNINYATLWENYKTIDGDIKNGDTIYFWQLENHIINDNFKTMDLAAVEGFKIINEMSKYWNVEIGLSIYTLDNQRDKFYLGGLKIGDYETVGIGKTPGDQVAFIHTHVAEEVVIPGRRDNSFFLSGRDFLAGATQVFYENIEPILKNTTMYSAKSGISTYMKHVAKPKILKAERLNLSSKQVITYLEKQWIGGKILDCYRKEECYNNFRKTNNTNCQAATKELLVRFDEKTLTGYLSVFKEDIEKDRSNFTLNTSNCLFGLFLELEQKVIPII